jgi:hypothetical protein
MASKQTLILSLPDSAASFTSSMGISTATTPSPHQGITGLINYLKAIQGGIRSGSITLYAGSVQNTAVITVTGAASNDETMVVCGVTFTAKTSGATGNEFNLSATPTTQATNMVTAFNASSDLTGIVTASNVAGVITLTAVVPGKVGNALVVTESLSNCTVTTTFATSAAGSNGDIYTFDLS